MKMLHGGTYNYYVAVTYMAAGLPAAVCIVILPVAMLIIFWCLWFRVRPAKENELREPTADIPKLPTTSATANSSNQHSDPSEEKIKKIYKTVPDSQSKTIKLLRGFIQATVRVAQYLYGPTSVKLKNKKTYKTTCLKIGGEYFTITPTVITSFIWLNCTVIGILITVAFNFLIVHESYDCMEDKVDCFLLENSTKIPRNECSLYKDENYICYKLAFRPSIVAALVGGILKIGPPILFAISNTVYSCIPQWCKLVVYIIVFFIMSIILTYFPIVTALVKFRVFPKLSDFVNESEERHAQIFAGVFIVCVFLFFPWFRLDPAKINEVQGRHGREYQDQEGANEH